MLRMLHRSETVAARTVLTSVIGEGRRRLDGKTRADIPFSNLPRNPWVVELHFAACLRWLANDPPAIAEAERTIELLRRAAEQDGIFITTGIEPQRADVTACVTELQRQLTRLVEALRQRHHDQSL